MVGQINAEINLPNLLATVFTTTRREQGEVPFAVDASGRIYTGYLISYPYIGRGMVIFRDPHGHRMITTPVKRVLGEPGGKMIYVETENSVYRLEIHGEPLFPMRATGE